VSDADIAPSLLAALRECLAAASVDRIDRVWLFPARRIGTELSSVAILSLLPPDRSAERRIIATLQHVTGAADKDGRVEDRYLELGDAPSDRVESVVRGVLHRLRDAPEEPRLAEIRGDAGRWAALVGEAAAA
jgi:hypothetical protein